MAEINLFLAKLIVENANSQNGLGWLQWYSVHRVFHPGWDINKKPNDFNLPVLSPYSGIVEFVYRGRWHNGFGIFVVLWHEEMKRWTRFAHLNSTKAEIGQAIGIGQEIGRLGKTGTTNPHLHFEVWRKSLHELQIKYWKGKYKFYPVNWTKWKVAQYYEDPEIFLRKCHKFIINKKKKEQEKIPSEWAKEIWEEAQTQKIVQNNDPHKSVTKEELMVILHRLDILKIKKSS